jgi:hypothetical protein
VPQLPFAGVDLVVQVVDEGQGCGDVAEPWLGQRQTPKQLAPAGAEQVADRTGSLRGHIYFHLGDDSGFWAVRAEDAPKPEVERYPKG